jgi:hypothetical protein
MPEATWIEPDSRFSALLGERLGPTVHIYPFRWSGRNGIKARARASVALAEHIARVAAKHPDAHHYVIAHSHGGNVLAKALSTSKLADKVHGTVCLSTPFLAISQRQFGPFLRTNLVVAGLVWSYVLGGLVTYESQASQGTAEFLLFLRVLILNAFLLSLNSDVQRWTSAFVNRRRADVEHPAGAAPPMLLVRPPSDEASGLLTTIQFLSWISTNLARLVNDWTGRLQSWLAPKPDAAERSVVAVGMHVWLSGAALLALSLWLTSVFMSSTATPTTRRIALAIVSILAGPTLVLTAVMALVFLLLSVLLAFFGPELAIVGVLLDVSVEPAPPGYSAIYQLPVSDRRGFRHSEPYEDETAIRFIAAWIHTRG